MLIIVSLRVSRIAAYNRAQLVVHARGIVCRIARPAASVRPSDRHIWAGVTTNSFQRLYFFSFSGFLVLLPLGAPGGGRIIIVGLPSFYLSYPGHMQPSYGRPY